MISNEKKELDYGIDAPSIRNGMIVIAAIGFVIVCLAQVVFINLFKNTPTFTFILSLIGMSIALYGSFMACYMTYSSKIGKLKTRDRLLDEVGKYLKWENIENSLDIGCGNGLLLIGSAKKISNGVSIGIDIWSKVDQSNNGKSTTIKNAELEGVLDKVQIQTADARNLPFTNGSLDLVMSHWVIHNIESKNEQLQSLNEMYRVLKPGGAILIADIQNVKNYCTHLEAMGTKTIYYNDGGIEAKVMSILSGGTYVPQSMICIKPK